MAYPVSERSALKKNVFWRSALEAFSGSGDFHVKFNPPRYPRDARRQDLARIGQDMYRAMGQYAQAETAKKQSS